MWNRFFLSVYLVIAFGCSQGSIDRCAVSGKVSLNNQPVANGQIRFLPIGSTQGPSWTVNIKDGQYSTEGTKGVPAGELRVEIKGFRVPSWYKGAVDPEGETPLEQFVPAEFNVNSNLKCNLPHGSKNVEKNWDLTVNNPA